MNEFNSLTIAAAARFLGVSRPTVYAWIKAGRLNAHEAHGRTWLRRKDLERLKARRLSR